MPRLPISNVITHPRLERKTSAIRQTGFQFAFQAQKHMPLRAPMIRLISRGVFDHAHAYRAKILRPPPRFPTITRVFRCGNRTPVRRRECRSSHFHALSISSTRKTKPSAYKLRTLLQQFPLSISANLCYSSFALITSVVLCGPSVVVNASSENPRLQFSPYVISVIQN